MQVARAAILQLVRPAALLGSLSSHSSSLALTKRQERVAARGRGKCLSAVERRTNRCLQVFRVLNPVAEIRLL